MSLRKPKIRPISGGERHENIFIPEEDVFNKTRSEDNEDYKANLATIPT